MPTASRPSDRRRGHRREALDPQALSELHGHWSALTCIHNSAGISLLVLRVALRAGCKAEAADPVQTRLREERGVGAGELDCARGLAYRALQGA